MLTTILTKHLWKYASIHVYVDVCGENKIEMFPFIL